MPQQSRQTQPILARRKPPPPTWPEYLSSFIWTPSTPKPQRATDASHNPALRAHFLTLLDNTSPPDSFRVSDVAQSLNDAELFRLGYEDWREALPAVLELAFELREFGYCEMLRKGKIMGEDMGVMDVEGSGGAVRVRRMEGTASGLSDDW